MSKSCCQQPVSSCGTPTTAQDCCTPSGPGVTLIDSWDMPVVTGEIDVTALGRVSLPIGAYVWGPDIGYLQITLVNVNSDAGVTVFTLKNNGTSGNAAPGTEVTPYSIFIPTPTPS